MNLSFQNTETLSDAKISWTVLSVQGVGRVEITLSYACNTCAGYGSPCRSCDGKGTFEEKHTANSLSKRLGPDTYESVVKAILRAMNEAW